MALTVVDLALLSVGCLLGYWLFAESNLSRTEVVPWFVVYNPFAYPLVVLGLAALYSAKMYHRQIVAAQIPWYYEIGKRELDIAISILAVVLFAPVWLLIAAGIKLGSRGPVIFRQIRVGKDLEPFEIYKFRTMSLELDGGHHDVAATEGASGDQVDESRLTPLGRFLRRYSLDELPQVINVLKGEMSWIGPRPHIPEEVARYKPWQLKKYDILPGVTGLAQVSGRKDLTQDDKARLDLFYISHMSLLLDLGILLRTIPNVLTGRGAY